MQKRKAIAKAAYAFGSGVFLGFGAGVALRASFPKSAQIAVLLLEKLGFDLADILLMVWDPEKRIQERALPPPRSAEVEINAEILPPRPPARSPVKKRRKPVATKMTARVAVSNPRRRPAALSSR